MYLSQKIFVFLCWMSTIATTFADYCEWGYCALSERCCGDNRCCANDVATWMLVGGLLSILVLVSVCCGCFYRRIDYYRLRMQWPFSSNDPLIPQPKA